MIGPVNPEHLQQAIDEHAIVSVTDAAGNIIYANQKFADISGYSLSELVGKNHRILKSGIHPSSFYHQMWDALLSGETWHGEVSNRRKNGEYYWVRASIVPILDPNGLPVQYISIRTDITDVKQAEAKLHETNAELEKYREFSEYELDVARELMQRMIHQSSSQVKNAELWIQSATKLSGDLVITQNYFNERSYILLADAMGHGLQAALPLIPIVQTFAKMAQDGFTVSAMIREMNRAVSDFMPVGRFVAITLLSVDCTNRLIHVWNGGNPPALLVNSAGDVIHQFTSRHLALGIIRDNGFDSTFDSTTESFHWNEECWLTLHSDGLADAQNVQGEAFGEDRIITALKGSNPHQSVKNAILEHLGNRDAGDDISIATIRLHGSLPT
jgi:PAS domain S-box-containing protein